MRSQDSPDIDITIDAEVEVPGEVTVGTVTSLVRHVLLAEGHDDAWEMAIRFVDDPTMQAAHVEFMDIDEPTDIMTFPYEDEAFGTESTDGWAEAAGGDLIISVDRAAENAKSAGWETKEELLFLIVHGVLHLLGWDDASDEQRSAMLDRQAVLISEWRASPEATY